jgi:hypothetical protein
MLVGLEGSRKHAFCASLAEKFVSRTYSIDHSNHVPTQEETILEDVKEYLGYDRFANRLVIVERVDTISHACQKGLLTLIEHSLASGSVAWVFTARETSKCEPALRSRCIPIRCQVVAPVTRKLSTRVREIMTERVPENVRRSII